MKAKTETVGGHRWHWLEAGPPDGPPVVLIHGAGGTGQKWHRQIAGLMAAGCRALAPDLPGHGESEGPGRASIAEYADLVAAWMDALGLRRAGVAGHSMGGAIVLQLALQGAPAAWLGLIATGAKLRVHPSFLARLSERDAPEQFVQALFSSPPDAALVSAERDAWRATDPHVRLGDFQACDRFDVVGQLGGIAQPALVLVGREDKMTPVKFSNYLAHEIPDSRLVIVEGAGHYVQLEQPEAVTAALINMARNY